DGATIGRPPRVVNSPRGRVRRQPSRTSWTITPSPEARARGPSAVTSAAPRARAAASSPRHATRRAKLPALGARAALEPTAARPASDRPAPLAGPPPAVEAAFLRLDTLPVEVAGVHEPRIHADAVAQHRVARSGARVRPRGRTRHAVADHEVEVASHALELAE